MGTIEIAGARPRPKNPVLVIILFVTASVLVFAPYPILALVFPEPLCFGAIFIFQVIYLPLGFFLRPKPRMDNIGLIGPLVGHPFRYSDDINRLLLRWLILLFPGRLISTWLVDFFIMLVLLARKRYY